MNDRDNRYGIYVSIVTLKIFEENRTRLGLSQEAYLVNLMSKDYTGVAHLPKFKPIDLNQSRLYKKGDLKPDGVVKNGEIKTI